MVNKIHNIMLDDHRMKVVEIVKIADSLNERIFNVLHEHLDMKK